MRFFEALNESLREHCAQMAEMSEEGKGFKELLHQTVLERVAFGFTKSELEGYDDDQVDDKAGEVAPHAEEIARFKREREWELFNERKEEFCQQRLKTVVLLIESDGWFPDDDDEIFTFF